MQHVLKAVMIVHEKLAVAANTPGLSIEINGVDAYDSSTDSLKVKVAQNGQSNTFTIDSFIERFRSGALDDDYFRAAAYHIDHLLAA